MDKRRRACGLEGEGDDSWEAPCVSGVVHLFSSPKEDIYHLKALFISEEAVIVRRLEVRETYLANFLAHVLRIFGQQESRGRGGR